MAEIVPTITTNDPNLFRQNLENFAKFAKRIQIDTSDGSFAPTTLVSLSDMDQFSAGVKIDLHLMTAQPSSYLPQIINLKPSLCIVHAEVNDDINNIFAELKQAGIEVGLALLKTTFPGKVTAAIQTADHVMIFAGELGRQGGRIDMLQAEKVPLIRAINPTVEIGWDGGANLSNVRALAHDEVNVINVGSAISSAADPAAMYQSLVAESEKKGVLL